MEAELAKLARRIARAFREFGGFIYQKELDSPEAVGRVVRESGVGLLVINKVLSTGENAVYALILNDKGCRTECVYGGPCSAEDKACIEKCVEECKARLRDRVVEALEKYAERVEKRAR